MDEKWEQNVAGIALGVMLAFAIAPCVAPASAPSISRDAYDLARYSVNEAGLDPTDDIHGLADSFRFLARKRGWSFGAAMHARARWVFNPERGDRRRWVTHLRLDGRRPDGWLDRDGDWKEARSKWIARLELAQRIVDGIEPTTCEAEVFHWGGPNVDRARIERGIARGYWRVVDCGRTRNTFLGPARALPQASDDSR